MANEYEFSVREKKRRPRKGLSRFKLKVIAAVLLFLGAASTTLFPYWLGTPDANNMTSLTVSVLSEIASWVAVPMYAWFVYSGYQYTHNAVLYGVRLLVLALVCEVPYDLMVSGHAISMGAQNPVWGLLISLIVIGLLDLLRAYSRSMQIILSVIVVLVGLAWSWLFRVGDTGLVINIGVMSVLFTLIFYFFDGRENTMMLTAGFFGAMMMIAPAVGVAILHYRNDETGARHSWTKWVWYAVYPVILLVCAPLHAL
ncbi:TraX family protein [Bifidobacterium gallicum]|uniref:ABC transporter permease n=1 Tax=Bifidobacterium gallicum DSM 20093 = LMG 11596 TaxID=561180 RepID=D1NX28_9BIFI|nr:TraX family protein [Bifidobacterium gallicum]EFA22088.1 hypothetical protein BIFGAL_04436 [Bifidobacterium gallicum DSM 20093 = LMG 11596]KFI59345.1 ABC transporter permease [Bifidobacterium gallicum DSM 20093 = LMG 11596]